MRLNGLIVGPALVVALGMMGCGSGDDRPTNVAAGTMSPGDIGAVAIDPNTGLPVETMPGVSGDQVVAGAPAIEDGNGAVTPQTGTTGGEGLPDGWVTSRGTCDLNSGYAGDEACLLPPPADLGMQIHIGPADYSGSAAPYVLQPGQEVTQCNNFKMPNSEMFYYQGWEFSGRPGTHHVINSLVSSNYADGWAGTVSRPGSCDDGGTGSAQSRIGGLPGASKAFMPRGPVAPENATLGAPVQGGNVQGQADTHYFNVTDAPLLREFWMNLYYIDSALVTEEAKGIRGMGGLSWTFSPIPARSQRVYNYTCAAEGNAPGRIVMLLGHTHAHGVRETAWVHTGGERIKVFEQFDYRDPKIFYYNSVTDNPDFAPQVAGAATGIIDVNPGDVLEWECDVNNDSDVALTYTNEVFEGEMCNIWGSSVGLEFNCVIF